MANGGYDCEFVEKPTSAFQTDCPICLLKLHDPYIVSCCGKSYCEDCIKRVQYLDNQCPACRFQFFDIFPNKGLKQSLNQLHVYCTHRKDGCKWKGELGQLEQHLNKNFAPDEESVGCPFATIKCIHCSKQFQRHRLQEHPFASCPERKVRCKYCNQAYALGELKQQSNMNTSAENWLEHHISNECPFTVVDCDYHSAGCNVQLPRIDMPAHLAEYVDTHLDLLGAENKYLLEEILRKNVLIKKLKLSLGLNLATFLVLCLAVLYYIGFPVVEVVLTLTVGILILLINNRFNANTTSVIPYTVSVGKFEQLWSSRTLWYSPPFYTHPQGYKLCLQVDANGDGANVSVFICLMQGEFDDRLKWPFRGDITIQILNQEGKEGHRTRIISFTDRTPDNIAGKQLAAGERNFGWGRFRFISHNELSPKYLKKDCLQFRVSEVKLKN